MRAIPYLIISCVALLSFLPFVGNVHLFDWDEVNFAEIAREMLILKDFLRIHVQFIPFHEKPPMFFWMQALSMHFFGIHEMAARFPNVICGIITLCVLFREGKVLKGTSFGWTWAIVYFGTCLPNFYFRSGIIDPWLNLFIFLSLFDFIKYNWKHNGCLGVDLPRSANSYMLRSGAWIGLGILTKGPVAFLIFALCAFVYWAYRRFTFYFKIPHLFLYACTALFVTMIWYGLETWQHGPEFIKQFSIRQYALFSTPDAGHSGFPGYHFVVLLFGCFPASLFLLFAAKKDSDESSALQDYKIWMWILMGVVLVLFTIVRSKIVHYSSMAYFPISFLAAHYIHKNVEQGKPFAKSLILMILLFGIAISLVPATLPFIVKQQELLRSLLAKDSFALGNLEAQVHWTGFEWMSGVFLFVVVVLAVFYFNRMQLRRGFLILFLGNALAIQFILWAYVGRVEAFSQRAAVEFCQNLGDKDCYIYPFGYRTYIPLFYGNAKPGAHPLSLDKEWLLKGAVDKDVYVIAKNSRAEEIHQFYPNLQFLGSKNGFIFFYRPGLK